MYVSKIRIKNLKTFDDVSLDLNKFNVLIGACGSGKTNFVQVLELLKSISYDFHEAIQNFGGAYLKNFNLFENNLESCLEVKFTNINQSIKSGKNNEFLLSFNNMDYEICFNFKDKSCEIQKELIKFYCDIKHLEDERIEKNEIIIKNNHGDIKAEFSKDMKDLEMSEIIPDALINIVSQKFKNNNTPLINSPLSIIPIDWGDYFKNISSYDFDPKICKNLDLTNNEKLSKHGGNLPAVLKNILNDENMKKEFLIYLINLLPYIKDVCVEKILDEERIFMIVEKYNDIKIPAPFVSDGTSTIMAILIALYFQEGDIILIEEPERHIRPSLIAQLMLMMESANKQVIITTHSPELLKYNELENLLFISRDENGFSNVQRVIDNDVVRPFIEELGIDNVFVNDYLDLN